MATNSPTLYFKNLLADLMSGDPYAIMPTIDSLYLAFIQETNGSPDISAIASSEAVDWKAYEIQMVSSGYARSPITLTLDDSVNPHVLKNESMFTSQQYDGADTYIKYLILTDSDDPEAGNPIFVITLTTARQLNAGDILYIPIDAIQISFQNVS